MSTAVIVYVLTALAAVVVVLTRLRLGRPDGAAGRFLVPRTLLHLHTGAGVAALVLWTTFLVAPQDSALGGDAPGIAGLACWWVTALAGLLILVRWLPARGRHAAQGRGDTWSEGPGLSLLAHVGMAVGVAIFTWAYLSQVV